jgi:fumarate reductase flavoprotein subunit
VANDYDVIVIGGGGAGMSAAIEAHDAGAHVLLVEAAARLGGSTALSGGVYYAADTSVQRAAGIHDDTADAMFEYAMTLNQWRLDPAIVRALADGAGPGVEWLISLGVEFRPEALYRSGVERVPRGHAAHGSGAAIAAALERAVRARMQAERAPNGNPAQRSGAIELALGNRVESLLFRDGAVRGVRARGEEATAASIVLASGGFGHSAELLARHYPEAAAAGDWTWCISAPTCVGDGLRMAQRVGASIGGEDRGLLLTTPGFHKQLEVYVPGWIVYVNAQGRRFVDETAAYAVMAGVIRGQGGRCFAIFDEASRAQAKPAPEYADAFASGVLPLNWVAEVLAQQIAAGRILRADSLEALAKRAGIAPGALASTVALYNADCAAGRDRAFFKDAKQLRPIATPPFYAAEIRPAIVCLTSCGPRITPETRVLDVNERPIPGLFAAGEVTGNALGERYIGGGNSIANAIVFGRIAGRAAARER